MANSSDFKLKKTLPKSPLLLKDHLLDDFSSCSSNGFKSFPRRQCCTTVRFLLEVDLGKNLELYKKKELLKTKSKTASTTTQSAFQRASGAVINAIKLPFVSARSQSFLSKSFSRKFMKRSFWKRAQKKEIRRLKSFGESQPSDSCPPTVKSTVTDEKCKKLSPEKKMSKEVGVTAGECLPDTSIASTATSSVESTKKDWVNVEEKQQLSPVSVLDFPCDDEDEVSSPFHHTPQHSTGHDQKLLQKTRRIGNLSRVEPLNLEKRIALSESSNQNDTKIMVESFEFLERMKMMMPSMISFKFNPDKLLTDLFQETNKLDNAVLNVVIDWVKGEPQELLSGWEIQEHREAYTRDMEKDGKWRDLNEDQKELVLELEDQIFTDLVNDLCSC